MVLKDEEDDIIDITEKPETGDEVDITLKQSDLEDDE